MTRALLSRRQLLRGASGLALSLPWLSSLGASAKAASHPKRLVLVYNPNGTIQDQFWPTSGVGTSNFKLHGILSPLEAHREKLLLLKGLNINVAEIGPGGPHQKGIGGLFTGRELVTGFFSDGCGSMAGWAAGMSVEQVIAKKSPTVFPSLELGVRAIKADVQSRISYAGASQPLSPMTEPLTVYSRLFSFSGSASETSPELRAQRTSVLDTVQKQLNNLSQRVSSDDRRILDKHATFVRDLEKRLRISAVKCAKPDKPPKLDDDNQDTMEQIGELQVDLLALALGCDLTRVGSLQFSTGYNRILMPWVKSDREGHTLSHAGPSDTDARTQLIRRESWYAAMVARLLDRLAAIPEGDGSVLDNTLVVWGNEIGVGSTHSHENIPFLLAGGAGGALKMGRYLDFKGKSHNDLLVSVLNAMDVDTRTFGHPDYVTGPLSGLTT